MSRDVQRNDRRIMRWSERGCPSSVIDRLYLILLRILRLDCQQWKPEVVWDLVHKTPYRPSKNTLKVLASASSGELSLPHEQNRRDGLDGIYVSHQERCRQAVSPAIIQVVGMSKLVFGAPF